MNILIIGCGTMGSTLAAELDRKGNDISIIDRNPESFEALPPDFNGFTATGVAIDRDVLKRAGIESCDAFFAVTENDDMNLMTAQIAREVFNIPKIFVRVDNIGKCRVFENVGVNIISPTKLTVSAACAALEEEATRDRVLSFGNARITFSIIDLPENYVGSVPEDIELEEEETLFGIIRGEAGFILYNNVPVTFESGDKLVFAKKN